MSDEPKIFTISPAEDAPLRSDTFGYLNEISRLTAALALAEAEGAELREVLQTVGDFAVGNGDVCEIIAKRCRTALSTSTLGTATLERIKALEEALEPFGKCAVNFVDNSDHGVVWPPHEHMRVRGHITIGDLRRAAASMGEG